MEEDFIVRTVREGTVNVNTAIEDEITKMGQTAFSIRNLGSVTVLVERSGGVNTKEKIRWGAGNDPKFNDAMKASADVILANAVKLVEGGGDDGDLRVKIISKK